MVRDGYFGFKDYFKSLCDSIEGDGDFYLLGSDFVSYLEAQVKFVSRPETKIVYSYYLNGACSLTWISTSGCC